ncbi:MAG: hypothetical protein R2755_26500 [Acidimicrobiales bacterium]
MDASNRRSPRARRLNRFGMAGSVHGHRFHRPSPRPSIALQRRLRTDDGQQCRIHAVHGIGANPHLRSALGALQQPMLCDEGRVPIDPALPIGLLLLCGGQAMIGPVDCLIETGEPERCCRVSIR